MENPLKAWLQRIAGAFIFISFGIWQLVQPAYWTAFVPAFFSHFISIDSLVMLQGVALLVIGLGFILLPRFIRWVAVLASLMLLSIVLALLLQFGWSDILVRDVSLLLYTASMVF